MSQVIQIANDRLFFPTQAITDCSLAADALRLNTETEISVLLISIPTEVLPEAAGRVGQKSAGLEKLKVPEMSERSMKVELMRCTSPPNLSE